MPSPVNFENRQHTVNQETVWELGDIQSDNLGTPGRDRPEKRQNMFFETKIGFFTYINMRAMS